MNLRRFLFVIFSVALVALTLTACGGGADNGVAAKSPNDIASAAVNAVARANSVHVSGALSTGGAPFRLDLSLVNGKGGLGSMAQGGQSFKIVTVDQEVYINGSSTFWSHYGGAGAAQLLSGKWLKAPATGQFATLATFTNPQKLFNQLVSGHLAKGKTTTIRGQKVIAVSSTGSGGTVYVATTGKPYPVAVVENGAGGGRLDFDRFNQPVALNPPANAIDISRLK